MDRRGCRPLLPGECENRLRLAPLRRVDIHAPWPDDLAAIRPEHFTPTFVLVENGREIDRLRGYPGDEFFWSLLDGMLAKLGTD